MEKSLDTIYLGKHTPVELKCYDWRPSSYVEIPLRTKLLTQIVITNNLITFIR